MFPGSSHAGSGLGGCCGNSLSLLPISFPAHHPTARRICYLILVHIWSFIFYKSGKGCVFLIVGGVCLGSAQALVWQNPAQDGGCEPGCFIFTDTKMVLALQKCPPLSGDGCAGWVWVQAGGLTSDFYMAKWLYSHK